MLRKGQELDQTPHPSSFSIGLVGNTSRQSSLAQSQNSQWSTVLLNNWTTAPSECGVWVRAQICVYMCETYAHILPCCYSNQTCMQCALHVRWCGYFWCVAWNQLRHSVYNNMLVIYADYLCKGTRWARAAPASSPLPIGVGGRAWRETSFSLAATELSNGFGLLAASSPAGKGLQLGSPSLACLWTNGVSSINWLSFVNDKHAEDMLVNHALTFNL